MCMKCKRLGKSVGKLVASGQGGFLNPPTHPEHSWSIRSIHGQTFFMSLTGAVEADWLADETRAIAYRKLATWVRPALASDEVRAWIKDVLAYFRHCYRGIQHDETAWHASNVQVNAKADELANAEIHAGVHYVRKYYPEFVPVADDFTGTWGKRND